MFSLSKKFELANDQILIGRVAMAIYSVCYDIVEEDQDIPNNPIRVRLASSFLQSQPEQIHRFSNMVINNPEVAEIDPESHLDISDALILKIVLRSWNKIAGIIE